MVQEKLADLRMLLEMQNTGLLHLLLFSNAKPAKDQELSGSLRLTRLLVEEQKVDAIIVENTQKQLQDALVTDQSMTKYLQSTPFGFSYSHIPKENWDKAFPKKKEKKDKNKESNNNKDSQPVVLNG